MRTKRLLKRITAVLVLIIVLIGASAFYYSQSYYRADDKALSFCSSTASVQVAYSDSVIIFTPEKVTDNHTGFIFYPGGAVEYSAYAPLMSMLAKNGVTCFLLKMPLNLAIFDINAANGIIECNPDIESWYIGGHSLGGVAASKHISKHIDDFDGLVLLGSYSTEDLSSAKLKVLSVYGENDGVMNRTNYEKYKSYLPSDMVEYVIPDGCHAYFGSYGEQKGDGKASITPVQQQEMSAELMDSFFYFLP